MSHWMSLKGRLLMINCTVAYVNVKAGHGRNVAYHFCLLAYNTIDTITGKLIKG